MIWFQQFFLDREQDIVVDLYMEGDRLFHVIRTPNHHTGNLITNLARLCGLETETGEQGLLVILCGVFLGVFVFAAYQLYTTFAGYHAASKQYSDNKLKIGFA